MIFQFLILQAWVLAGLLAAPTLIKWLKNKLNQRIDKRDVTHIWMACCVFGPWTYLLLIVIYWSGRR